MFGNRIKWRSDCVEWLSGKHHLALVLAVGRIYTRGRIYERLNRQFAGHEIIVAALTSEAFARVGPRVPDLVLFPSSLFPSERAALTSRLSEWSGDGASGPARMSPGTAGEDDAQWFYWFKSRARQLPVPERIATSEPATTLP